MVAFLSEDKRLGALGAVVAGETGFVRAARAQPISLRAGVADAIFGVAGASLVAKLAKRTRFGTLLALTVTFKPLVACAIFCIATTLETLSTVESCIARVTIRAGPPQLARLGLAVAVPGLPVIAHAMQAHAGYFALRASKTLRADVAVLTRPLLSIALALAVTITLYAVVTHAVLTGAIRCAVSAKVVRGAIGAISRKAGRKESITGCARAPVFLCNVVAYTVVALAWLLALISEHGIDAGVAVGAVEIVSARVRCAMPLLIRSCTVCTRTKFADTLVTLALLAQCASIAIDPSVVLVTRAIDAVAMAFDARVACTILARAFLVTFRPPHCFDTIVTVVHWGA